MDREYHPRQFEDGPRPRPKRMYSLFISYGFINYTARWTDTWSSQLATIRRGA
jgi:hypothetical protein